MEWFYAEAGKQLGPVSEEEFNRLISAGRITPITLVWRQGLSDWQPLQTAIPADAVANLVPPPSQPIPAQASAAPPVIAGPSAPCSECGSVLPKDEMIAYGPHWVCAQCKPVFFQRIREGAPPPSSGAQVWRSDDEVVVASGTPLPNRCAKCNKPVSSPPIQRTLYWHPIWIYVLILINLLIYIVVALIVRKKAKVAIPMCDEHRSKRWTIILVSWLLVLGGIVGLPTGLVNDLGVLAAIGVLSLLSGIILGIWKGTLVSTKKIKGEYVWIRGFCGEYVDSLPEFPGEQ